MFTSPKFTSLSPAEREGLLRYRYVVSLHSARTRGFSSLFFTSNLMFTSPKFTSLSPAEREGFEPSVPLSQYTHFPGVLLQPLGHLSSFLISIPNISIVFKILAKIFVSFTLFWRAKVQKKYYAPYIPTK